MMTSTKLPSAVFALTLAFAPQTDRASGSVFLDTDGDGVRDTGERGLSGVVVSDQIEVTTTDGEGRYELPAGKGEFVFVTLPRGQRATSGFWRRRDSGAMDFGLQSSGTGDSFTFIHASDSHTDPQSVERLTRV